MMREIFKVFAFWAERHLMRVVITGEAAPGKFTLEARVKDMRGFANGQVELESGTDDGRNYYKLRAEMQRMYDSILEDNTHQINRDAARSFE
jgi:hypothetical protein